MAEHLNLYITGGRRPPGDGARVLNSDVPPTVGWSQQRRGVHRGLAPAIAAVREAFDAGAWPERERAAVLRRTRDVMGRDRKAFWIAATREMSATQEKSFGPVLTVETFADEDEAVLLANDAVGLAGTVWSLDAGRHQCVANRLWHGTSWINDDHPYVPQAEWGGMKRSGNGRELGRVGSDGYAKSSTSGRTPIHCPNAGCGDNPGAIAFRSTDSPRS